MPTYTRIWKGYLYFFIGKKYILEIIINILLPTTTTDMGDRPNQVPNDSRGRRNARSRRWRRRGRKGAVVEPLEFP